MPAFLGRYGGNNFIFILHPDLEEHPYDLIADIRGGIDEKLVHTGTPYPLAVSLGYDELGAQEDDIQACIQRAAQNLYLDKAHLS